MKNLLYIFFILVFTSCGNKLFSTYTVDGKRFEKINLSKLEEYASKENKHFTRNTGYANINQSSESYILTSKKDTSLRVIVQKQDGIYTGIIKAVLKSDRVVGTHFYPNGLFKSQAIGTSEYGYSETEFIPNISFEIAPNFTVKDVNDKKISLLDYRGYYVYINVWATWSRPSEREIIAFNNLIDNYGGKNIVFINISIDRKEDISKWKNVVLEKNLKGVQLYGGDFWYSEFVSDYQIRSIPNSLLIDPSGIVLNKLAPSPSDKKINEILELIYDYGK